MVPSDQVYTESTHEMRRVKVAKSTNFVCGRGRVGRPGRAPGGASVVVATFAMDMTVLDFLGGGIAHFGDFHREMQGLASERVVAVDGHLAVTNLGNGKQAHAHAG